MITVLSPHRDDAAFSLALAIQSWTAAGEIVSVVNVFTRSIYAPLADVEGEAAISALRRDEDTRFQQPFGDALRFEDLGRGEALLRDYDGDDSFIHDGPLSSGDAVEVAWLTERFATWRHEGPVYAPLAFGDHVDHRIVRDVARQVWPADRLWFYEDLPYGCGAIEALELHAQKVLGATPTSKLLGADASLNGKFEALRSYASQASMGDIVAMLSHAKSHGRAERVWAAASR